MECLHTGEDVSNNESYESSPHGYSVVFNYYLTRVTAINTPAADTCRKVTVQSTTGCHPRPSHLSIRSIVEVASF